MGRERERRGGKGLKRPANFTADRLDGVLKGQLVHLDVPALDATPSDGWLEVLGVVNNGAVVSLTFAGGESFNGTPDLLVRVGWAD